MSVQALRNSLTEDDVRRLVRANSEEERALSAFKICRKIARDGLSEDERSAANEILKLMAHDAAAMVRRALAVTLRNSPHLPHDVAEKLIADIDDIAVPVIEASPVLTDEDLVRVLEAGNETRQSAVASRETVSGPVCEAIVSLCGVAPNSVLARNDGAELSGGSFNLMIDRFGDSEAVTGALIERSSLPLEVTEKLVSLISDEALRRLSKRHALPPQLAVELAEGARESVTIDLIDQADCAEDIQRFVQQLQLNARLTPSLIVRAAACGSMRFLEWSLAELSSVPHGKAWLLIHDAGPLGLKAIFDRTGLPPRLFPILRMAIEIYHETSIGMPNDPDQARRIMLERVLTRYQAFEEEDLDYLLARLDVQDAPADTRDEIAA